MSSRQIDILQALADGLSFVQIAEDWDLSYGYTKHVMTEIRNFLGADTNCQAVAMGLRRGLIS